MARPGFLGGDGDVMNVFARKLFQGLAAAFGESRRLYREGRVRHRNSEWYTRTIP